MYSLVKPLLFALDPERAHAFSMAMLAYIPNCCFAALYRLSDLILRIELAWRLDSINLGLIWTFYRS